MPYSKPYLPIPDQLELVKSRGMSVADEAKASQALARIGYYRLSAYWYPFRKSEIHKTPDGSLKTRVLDGYRDGTDFGTILDLYVFDKKLRILVLDALERIEIGLRTDIALRIGQHDPWSYRDPKYLHGNFAKRPSKKLAPLTDHQDWLRRFDDKFQKSKEDFAKHFKAKYPGESPPDLGSRRTLGFRYDVPPLQRSVDCRSRGDLPPIRDA